MRIMTILRAMLVLALPAVFAACGGGLGGDAPNSAEIVDMQGRGCVGAVGACPVQYEWQTAKCEEVPISGLPLGRCWMTKRYAFVNSNAQAFEAVSTGDGNINIGLSRGYGYGLTYTGGIASAEYVRLYQAIRWQGRGLRTSNLKLVRDDGGGSFAVSFDLPNLTCQSYYRDGRRAGENPNLLLRVTYTLCRPNGQTVTPEEVMALVPTVKFR